MRFFRGRAPRGEGGADGGLVAEQVAQNGVDEAGGGGAVERLERLDRGVDLGVLRDVGHEQDLGRAEQQRRVGVGVLGAGADEAVHREGERARVAHRRIDQIHHEAPAEGGDVPEHAVGELARLLPAGEDAERVDARQRPVVGTGAERPPRIEGSLRFHGRGV